jgi:hypothetical protein
MWGELTRMPTSNGEDRGSNNGMAVLLQSAIYRGKFLFLSIMNQYTEVTMRHCASKSRINLLDSLRKKVKSILNNIHDTPWNHHEDNCRYDTDLIASEVFELLQDSENEELKDCTNHFIALCNGMETFSASSYVSYMDLCNALGASHHHLGFCKAKEDRVAESKAIKDEAWEGDLKILNLKRAYKDVFQNPPNSEEIAKKTRGLKSPMNLMWSQMGFQTCPRGVTATRNPEIYRVQISLRKGQQRASHNVDGLENALFLYDILLILSDSFNQPPSIERGNYKSLTELNMITGVENYSLKFMEKVHYYSNEQFKSKVPILSKVDVERIEQRHKHRMKQI